MQFIKKLTKSANKCIEKIYFWSQLSMVQIKI